MRNDLGLSQAQILAIRREARLELARRYAKAKDILSWGKIVFPDKYDLPFCPSLHGYFVEIRGDEFTDTEAPRGFSKTAIKCNLIPIFQALEEPETFKHYLNVQATQDKALALNRGIKAEFEQNEMLFALYGNTIGERWTDQQFVLKNGICFSAIGAGQSIRGFSYRLRRPDYVMVDDLYDEDEINNYEATEKKNSWLLGSLYQARASGRSCFHVQGTAINKGDILEILKEKPGFKSRTFQAIIDEEKKLVLWPEKKSFETLMVDRENMGTIIFNREMQNSRRDDAESIVKRSWLKFYDPDELKFDQQFTLAGVLLGCDPSIGEKSESDYTGIAVVLKARHADSSGYQFYIDSVWNEHLSLHERIKLLQEIYSARPIQSRITRAFIEGIAGFKDFVAEVRRRTTLPVTEISTVKDKISNLESKSHLFENGKVFINKNIPAKIKDILIYQLTTNHPKHDDLRDSVLLCLSSHSVESFVTVVSC